MQHFAERDHFSFSGKLHSLRSVRFKLGEYAQMLVTLFRCDETLARLLVVAIQGARCDVGSRSLTCLTPTYTTSSERSQEQERAPSLCNRRDRARCDSQTALCGTIRFWALHLFTLYFCHSEVRALAPHTGIWGTFWRTSSGNSWSSEPPPSFSMDGVVRGLVFFISDMRQNSSR